MESLCECGCGQKIPATNKQGKKARFIHGHNTRGMIFKRTEEQKQAQSERQKGRIPWNKGVIGYEMPPASDERKRKISAALMGNTNTKGYKHSESTKHKMSEGRIGIEFSDEHLKNLSESHKGKKMLPESIQKRTEARKKNGYTPTEETRHKIGDAQKGELNHNWNNGSSFEPYCIKFNESFKESIRKKFDYMCFLCGKSEDEQRESQLRNGKRAFKLSVHHVNYNKNCLCDGIKCEFVPLCHSCHMKTNYNREYWEELCMTKLTEIANMMISDTGVSVVEASK